MMEEGNNIAMNQSDSMVGQDPMRPIGIMEDKERITARSNHVHRRRSPHVTNGSSNGNGNGNGNGNSSESKQHEPTARRESLGMIGVEQNGAATNGASILDEKQRYARRGRTHDPQEKGVHRPRDPFSTDQSNVILREKDQIAKRSAELKERRYQRHDDDDDDLVNVTPGAFAEGGRGRSTISFMSTESSIIDDNVDGNGGAGRDKNVLVEAMLVPPPNFSTYDDQVYDNKKTAHNGNVEMIAMATATKDPWWRQNPLWLILATTLVIIVIVLGVYFGVVSGQTSDSPARDDPEVIVFETDSETYMAALLQQSLPSSAASLSDESSIQYQALQAVARDDSFNDIDDSSKLQKYGLCTLYYSTDGETSWINATSSWLSESANSICEWYGVSCEDVEEEDSFLVSALELNSVNLNGPLPMELALLSDSLTHLDLSFNQLNETIPTELRAFTNLEILVIADNFNLETGLVPSGFLALTSLKHLDLSNTARAGSLQSGISALQQLTHLDLHQNFFNNELPIEITSLTSLKYLDLSDNNFENPADGLDRIENLRELVFFNIADNLFAGNVADVCSRRLGNLQHLDIGQNDFTGTLPIGNLNSLSNLIYLSLRDVKDLTSGSFPTLELSKLSHLDLEGCNLQGTIPASLGNLTELVYLNTGSNSLTGSIPSRLFDLVKLRHLEMRSNSLSSTISTRIGNLQNLTYLDLTSGSISGAIPDVLFELANLSSLSLNNHTLSGTIPPTVGNLRQLTKLDIADNRFTGTIPTEVGQLTKLQKLNAELNFFGGTIVEELPTTLEVLNLRSNFLTGTIPNDIGDLVLLRELDLERNFRLTGSIPTSVFDLSNLVVLNLGGNPFLSGTLETLLGQLTMLISLIIEGGDLTGSIPSEIGQLTRLQTLDCHKNDFVSTIPSEIGNLRSLRVLDMEANLLTGRIPEEFEILSSLKKLRLRYNNITGTIPEKVCGFDNDEGNVVDCILVSCTCCGCPQSPAPTPFPTAAPIIAAATLAPIRALTQEPAFSPTPVLPSGGLSPAPTPGSIVAPTSSPTSGSSSLPTSASTSGGSNPAPPSLPTPGPVSLAPVFNSPVVSAPFPFLPTFAPVGLPSSPPSQTSQPSVASDCLVNLTVACVPSDASLGGTCEFVSAASLRKLCTDQPKGLEFRYTGQTCTESSNKQPPQLFQCTDFGSSSAEEGSSNFIVVRDVQTEKVFHSGFVTIGDVYALDVNQRDMIGTLLDITVYTNDPSSSNSTVLQTVTLASSCNWDLFLFDTFGSHRLRQFVNNAQGTVSAEIDAALSFDILYSSENTESSVELEGLVSSTLNFGELDLSDSVRGKILQRGDSEVVESAVVLDLSIKTSYKLQSSVYGQSADGFCTASGDLEFVAGVFDSKTS